MKMRFFRCVLREDPAPHGWIMYAAAFTKREARMIIQDLVRDNMEGGICGIIPPLEEIEIQFERTRLSPDEWKARGDCSTQEEYEAMVRKIFWDRMNS